MLKSRNIADLKIKKQILNIKVQGKMQNEKDKFKEQYKKRLYSFTLKLVEETENLPNDNTSRRIGDQLLRSGTSIIANYVEGGASNSKKELINYFAICLKSCNESKVWLSLLKDTKKISEDKAKWFLDELNEFSKIFASSILTMKGKK